MQGQARRLKMGDIKMGDRSLTSEMGTGPTALKMGTGPKKTPNWGQTPKDRIGTLSAERPNGSIPIFSGLSLFLGLARLGRAPLSDKTA